METTPAPLRGRRAGFGAAALLVGYLLLAPPLYLLVPFALLTLLAGPRTLREFLWLAAAAAGSLAALSGGADLGPQLLRASALVTAGVFVLLSLRSRGPVFPRALLSLILAALGLVLWARSLGLAWGEIEAALTGMLRQGYQAMVDLAPPEGTSRQDMQAFVAPFIAAAPQVARVMPGVLALQALLGLALASAWHHRISVAPIGPAPASFPRFRFNDHLVWGAIFTLGMVLFPLPEPAAVLAANLLIVWAGLYATRGLAILASLLAPVPVTLKVMAGALGVVLLPLLLGATVALGLADTWLDIRGRFPPPAPEGA